MSPAEKAFVEKLRRRARRISPELARLELAAYEVIRSSLNERELVEAINAGWIEILIQEVLSDRELDPHLAELRLRIDQAVLDAAQLATRDLPERMRVSLDLLNPRVISAARALETRVIENVVKTELRETFRQHVIEGLREGLGPRTIARGARAMLGLAPNQEAAVRNFRRMLEEGDLTALSRKLRDRRFDRTVRRNAGDLSADQIDRMVDAYRRRMIAFNAETHARTAAIDAQKAGQRLSWEDALARGVVERGDLRRTWVTVGDSRVRPEHQAMNGETVGFDERFSNGEIQPGESTYNCRCQARVFVSRQREAIAA